MDRGTERADPRPSLRAVGQKVASAEWRTRHPRLWTRRVRGPRLKLMQRVLDLDLDFFVHGIEHWRDRDHGRLDAAEYPAWSLDETLDFLHTRCGLTSPLPGVVVEHHGELFLRWRDAIDARTLRAPFHVTHVDAHADLGLGDAGYVHLLTELMWRAPEGRRDPGAALNDGNYLAFAVGCRWLSGLDYVYNRDNPDGRNPGDIMPYIMEGFSSDANHIQLAALTREQIQELQGLGRPEPARLEPRVPLQAMGWPQFNAAEPFDLICLARSPECTPATCDALFDAIRDRFIDERAPRASARQAGTTT